MKLGIKVGLKGDSEKDLAETQPDFCEVWFDAGRIPEYDNLFASIKKYSKTAGLHFWGALDDKTLANLAYPDNKILTTSVQMVKNTIDTAAKHNFWYVNIHPGAARLTKVDFEKEDMHPYTEAVSFEKSAEILGEQLEILTNYAHQSGVELLIESVPMRYIGHPWHGTEGRDTPIDGAELPVSHLTKLLDLPWLYFTNDLGHTGANIISDSRDPILEYLQTTTHKLASKTKLLHVSYLIPPYNGSDYHGCLYYDEFKTHTAIPNYDEVKQLLKPFVHRPDVGALCEPEKDHPRNFQILKQLVEESS